MGKVIFMLLLAIIAFYSFHYHLKGDSIGSVVMEKSRLEKFIESNPHIMSTPENKREADAKLKTLNDRIIQLEGQ